MAISHKILRSKPFLFIASWFFRLCTELLYLTLRIEFRGVPSLPKSSIIALWHNRLILAPLVTRRFRNKHFTIAVSKSRDGMLLSTFAKTYKDVETIDISHHSRRKALVEMVEALKKDTALLITPDGPRGPKYSIKPGVSYAAKEAKVPIVTMTWTASSMWTLKTWDAMQIPKPFSKVIVTFSEPITIENMTIDEGKATVEKAL